MIGLVMPDLERAAACVQMFQAIGGGDPQRMRPGSAGGRCIVDHRAYLQVADAAARRIPWREALERPWCWVMPQDTASARADPQPAVAVFAQRGDPIVGQRKGVVRLVAEHDEAVAVVAGQSRLRTDPHEALAVLQDRSGR